MSFGIPYAKAIVNDDVYYALECPACGELCRGFDPRVMDDVDPEDVIRSAKRRYAEHYEQWHAPKPVSFDEVEAAGLDGTLRDR
jgi:hypothetical protein